MRYFKKVDPRVKVVLSNGAPLIFEAVSWELGVYPNEGKGISDWLAGEIQSCMNQGIGGITEITRDEYVALLELKKNNPEGLSRPTREVWEMPHRIEGDTQSGRQLVQTYPSSTPPAPAVAGANPPSQNPLTSLSPHTQNGQPPLTPLPDSVPKPTATKGDLPPPKV